jgi:hypothetical protein
VNHNTINNSNIANSTTSTSNKQFLDNSQNLQKKEVPINSKNFTVTPKNEDLEFLNRKKRNRQKSNESFDKSNFSNINEMSSISQSEISDKKTIFKTFKASRNSDSQNEMKKMMRLMKNRLSARKCRKKKKIYVEQMEEEILDLKCQLEKYKSIEKKEKSLEGMIKMVRM